MNPLPWIKLVKWLAIVAVVAGVVWWAAIAPRIALANEQAAHAKTKAENAEKWQRQAELTAKTAQAVRARETEVRGLLDASNAYREQGIAHAVESQQQLVAGLHAGTVRLRKQWADCAAGGELPGHAGTQPGANGGADLRAEAAGRIARAGDDADVQVRGLQAYARACQAMTAPVAP